MKAQDPVAWMAPNGLVNPFKTGPFNQPLYPCPQKREWVGLTDEEILESVEESNSVGVIDMARVMEAKIKEKNFG